MAAHSSRWIVACLAWTAAVLSLTAVPIVGQADKKKHIRFEATLSPADPFSDLNQVGRPTTAGMTVGRGETIHLTVRGVPEAGWHTYPLTRRAPDQSAAQLGTLKIEGEAFQPLYPLRESDAEWKDYRKELEAVYLEHEGPFTVTQEVYVKPSAAPGPTELTVRLRVQVCEKTCIWEDHDLKVPVTIQAGAELPPSLELQARLTAKPPAPEVVPLPERFKSAAASSPAAPAKDDRSSSPASRAPQGLFASVLTAIIGGFVSLMTPCVFPMIPITVSYFLKQSELPAGQGTDRPRSPVLMAAVYSGTIVLVLAAGGLVLMQVLVQISVHYATNFALAGIFLVFALSLLGMYDITLPSWLQDVTASREGQGGLLGVFFMALTFSIISFACVGPIYGGFISLEATGASAANRVRQVASVVAFSAAFASPFFVLALFPSLLRTMPRAGSWMNSVKVVMGFLELAAVVKFVRAGELALTAKSSLFTFDFSLALYVALSVAIGVYLLGLIKLPHDHDTADHIGVPRLLFALLFLTLAAYLTPGMFKGADGQPQQPRGQVYAWVESFLLPDTDAPTPSGYRPGNGPALVWHHDLDEALAQSKKDGKLLFLDFTGTLCTNCKLNERSVFPRPEVVEAFSRLTLLKLYTDTVPAGTNQKPDASGALTLRETTFKSAALPLYAILRPAGDRFEIVRTYDEGVINDVPRFVEFLRP